MNKCHFNERSEIILFASDVQKRFAIFEPEIHFFEYFVKLEFSKYCKFIKSFFLFEVEKVFSGYNRDLFECFLNTASELRT